MIRSLHRQLPAIPRGYAIAPAASWFSVLVPVARTNLITNPSFETNTTNWTAIGGSIARVATQQYHGVYSLQITPTAATTDGARFDTVTTVTSQLYAISCKFLGIAGVKYKISMATTGGVDLAAFVFTATGRWQWVSVYYQETAGTTRRVVVSKATSANTGVFYIDGVQVEAISAGEFVSTYIDGDQAGLVPNQFPAAYLWTGTPHASTSTRSGQTRAGGTVMRLDYYGFVLLAMIGLGLPTPTNVSVPYVLLDGAQYERTQKPPRQFTLAGRWDSASFPQLQRQISQFGAALDRDKVAQQQPIVLQYQALDDCNVPTSDVARIICSYQGGLEGVTDNLHAEQTSIVMKMWLPLIQGDGGERGDTRCPAKCSERELPAATCAKRDMERAGAGRVDSRERANRDDLRTGWDALCRRLFYAGQRCCGQEHRQTSKWRMEPGRPGGRCAGAHARGRPGRQNLHRRLLCAKWQRDTYPE